MTVSVEEIKTAVGEANTLALSQRLGGKFVYVPQTPTPDNILATVLDSDAQQALSDYAGGSVLYIPVGPAKRERNRLIDELKRTHSSRQIARIVGASARTVRHIHRQNAIDEQLSQRGGDDRPASEGAVAGATGSRAGA